MDALTLEIQLEPADLAALQRRILRRSRAQLINMILVVASFFIAGAIGARLYPQADYVHAMMTLYGGLILYLVLRVGFRDVVIRNAYGSNANIFMARQYIFDARGVRILSPHSDSFTAWPGFVRIEKLRDHIFLFLPGNAQAHVIPLRCLPPAATPDDVFRQLSSWRAQSGA